MILVVREYLNKQGPKANTTGLNEVLHTRNVAHMLDMTANAAGGAAGGTTTKITSVSTRTAQRWFAQCGWIYSRNKKGYIDDHERVDNCSYAWHGSL